MLGFVLNVLIHGLNQKTIFIRIFRVLHTVQFSRNFVLLLLYLSGNSDILSQCLLFVNNFFHLFLKFFFEVLQADERRKRDLNPRAGFPTYTLSRGASSASWVFLLITVANYHLLSLSGELARRRINYTSYSSFCQQLFSSFFTIFLQYDFSLYFYTRKAGNQLLFRLSVLRFLIWYYFWYSLIAVSYRLFPWESITTTTGKSSTSSFRIASVPRSS